MKPIARMFPLSFVLSLCLLALYAPEAQAGGGGLIKSRGFTKVSASGHGSQGYSAGGFTKVKFGQGSPAAPSKGSHQKAPSTWGSSGKQGAYGKGSGKSHGPSQGYGYGKSHGKSYGPSYGKGYGGNFSKGYGYAHGPKKVWVPGGWSLNKHKVWHPASYEKVWHGPVFQTHIQPCGTSIQVQISAGYYETLHSPGYWKWESQRAWTPAHWEYH